MEIPTNFDEPRERAEQRGDEYQYTPLGSEKKPYALYFVVALLLGILILIFIL